MSLSSYTIALVTLATSLVAAAQTQLVIRDDAGREMRRVPGIVVSDGIVAIGRSGLIGADRAQRLSSDAAGVIAEDQDADVVLLRLTHAQALSPFHEGDLNRGMVLAGGGFATVVENAYDVPGFGVVFRLRNEKNHPAQSAPLWNDKGEIAAWYVPKLIDGQRFSFAIPASRLQCIAPRKLTSLKEWNASLRRDSEEQFGRSIGYIWLQDFDGAAYHFGQFILQNTSHARGWFYLAFSEGKMGHDRKKLAAYRRAIELAPLWAEPRYNLGLGLLLSGEGDLASAEAAALTDIDPVMGQRLTAYIELAHVDPMPTRQPKPPEPASPRSAPR